MQINDTNNRRNFLKTTALAMPALLPAQQRNDAVRAALIGCGGRGTWDAKQFLSANNTELVAVCDPDQAQLKKFEQRVPGKRETYTDFRRMLDRKDIDAVIVATPDHWHVIPALWAIRAGKDVYMEKPVGHTIEEGLALVRLEKEHDRIVQIGLQQRSGTLFQEVRKIVQSGQIGKVSHVHCVNGWNVVADPKGSRGKPIGNPPDSEVPEGVDYDMWLGPAPKRPFNENRFHWNYIYFWDYSGGMILGWGVHLIDTAMWVMNAKGPLDASIAGGKYLFDDMRDTPDTAECVWTFPNFMMTYSCTHGTSFPAGGRRIDHSMHFLGSEATLIVDREGYKIIPEKEKGEPIVSAAGLKDGDTVHQHLFLDSVRSRKPAVVGALEGYRTTLPLHLANIAYRTKSTVRWDPETDKIADNPMASEMLRKKYRAPWSLS